ncbi:protein phosphatase 1 regulatory subunit 12B-like isoform X3 [Denticeps clupeoides]|uniref:protein phosphatase 1 regulatory subunit 12B-like isoform X3 n=1 Tax=Denticeps clupeoides TaxID=299321 RepID=UPI0010A41A9A|nr:protein phosphatase 1 regulatory subunit 12B-like isoform X3 [Denticeps clupeoides]
MQSCLPRPYLTPVRDEEAESLRKARSRHVRQTRRSTKGVTLAELKEAKRSLSTLDNQTDEECRSDPDCGAASVVCGCSEFEDRNGGWNKDTDELGNWLLGFPAEDCESLMTPVSLGACDTNALAGSECMDENENTVSTKHQRVQDNYGHTRTFQSTPEECSGSACSVHERASRSNSSGDGTADRVLSQTSYYTRRERRLASLNKEETDGGTKDYKKLYEDALTENEKLKSRLDDNKQEMSKIRSQLEKVVQKHDRISERMGVSETEKKEKQALEKRVSEMEEELKQTAPVRFRCGYQP